MIQTRVLACGAKALAALFFLLLAPCLAAQEGEEDLPPFEFEDDGHGHAEPPGLPDRPSYEPPVFVRSAVARLADRFQQGLEALDVEDEMARSRATWYRRAIDSSRRGSDSRAAYRVLYQERLVELGERLEREGMKDSELREKMLAPASSAHERFEKRLARPVALPPADGG